MFGRASELDQIGQALRRPDLVGVVLAGSPGAGKSTLLDAAATRAEEQGFEVIRLHANRATSTIPLLVFSTLLGRGDESATVERFVAVRYALRDRSQQRPLMLVIDDAHHLDDASAALIAQLARELTAFMIASVRTAEPTPEPIAALWTQGIAQRIDLRPLTREAATDVAGSVLGGLVDPALEAEVWRRAAGNPLHIRELILGSRAAGSIALVGDVWSRTGELVTSDALTDLVGHRVSLLSPLEQAALCAVALAEPAGVPLIERVADPGALVSLEEAGLVKVRQDRRRLVVSIVHPLYGDVVRTMTSQLRVRQMRRALAKAVSEWGQRRLDDLIQVATWRLDAQDIDPALFANGAFEALRRQDIDLAERLAEAAHEAHPGELSARALAMTRHLLGRHEDALAVLDVACAYPDLSAADLSRIKLLQGLVLARGKGDYEAGIAALTQIGDGATDRVRGRAHAMMALISLLQGRATDGLISAERLIAAGATEAEAYTALVGSLAVNGRPAQARRVADEYVVAHGEPDPRSLFFDFRWVALIESGQAVEMESELDLAWDTAVEVGDRHRQARLALAFGHVHVDTGRLSAAMAWFERSAALSRSVGERFGVRWALCGRLLAAGQLGDLVAADAASAGLAEVPGHPAELFELYGRRGAAWHTFARGHTTQAVNDLLALARRLADEGCINHAVRALVDAARMGEPAKALEVMSSLDVELDGELLPCCVDFVSALAARNPARLADTSTRFERVGYGGLAIAAAAAARDAYAKDGAKRDASTWDREVKRLSLASGAGPALMFTAADSASPLTRREREIAHLVANGHTSREVADACFLSARTVENHLARIYDKLGVRSRSELSDALRPLVAEGAA